jgi:hypothetical protein
MSFTKVDGNTIYGFNFFQTRYFYETKLLYDISVKKNLYKDSIIFSQDSIIDNLNTINKSTSVLLDTCSKRYDKSVNLNIKQDELINKMQDKINKKNIVVSFLGSSTICLTLFLLLF